MGTKAKKMGRPIKAPKPGERAALGFRITADTKHKLVSAAEKAGRSQSQEAEFRLEQSFSRDDAFGGSELRQIAFRMATAFAHAGQMHAGNKKPSEWISDRTSYQQAIISVVKALLIEFPNATRDDVELLFESVKSRILSDFANKNGAKQ